MMPNVTGGLVLVLISADSHVVEPADLWTSRLPAHLQDRAPRAVQDPVNHHWYVIGPDGARGVDLTLSRVAGMTTAEVQEILEADPSAEVGARGGADPVARLRDLWNDDTVVDVLYPTAGLSVLQMEDVELQEACCRAYNDWLVEFCATDPVRLIGLALLATNDIESTVAELERTREAGLRGAIIWSAPPPGQSFFDADYEPLWSAAAAARMPISLHILGGRKLSMNIKSFNQNLEGTFYGAFETRQEIHRSVCEFIAAGVFERHPDLRVGRRGGRHRVRRQPGAQARFRLHVVLEEVQQPVDDAVGVLPAQRLPDLHQRSARAQQPALHGFRPLHVVG